MEGRKKPAKMKAPGAEVKMLACWPVCSHAKSLQSCLTLCDPMDCNPPGSSVHGILQERILEWFAILPLQGIFQTQGLNRSLFCLLHWQTGSFPVPPPGKQ